MSVKVMSAVFERYPNGGGEMLLALALADVARDDGVLMLNRSVADLALKTRQTERGVQLQLRRMQEAGWLILLRANDGGRGRVSTYRISREWIDGAPISAPETLNAATVNPERGSGFAKPETLNAATVNPERGSGAIEPTRPKRNTPPNPPGGAGLDSSKSSESVSKPLMTLKAWLAQCRKQGVQPIAPDDPVFGYCEAVGIGQDVLALHWWQFKRKRSDARKRQRSWPQTFRNSVEDNWFRLWFLKPGFDAQLTTVGQQAQALMTADAAATKNDDEGAGQHEHR